MASTCTYKGWWDLSLIDDRNQRPLFSAFVAVVAVWALAFLFRACLSARLITVFHRASRRAQPMVASSPHGR
jgi:hypothetical protein